MTVTDSIDLFATSGISPPDPSPVLIAALTYAAAGLAVFPIHSVDPTTRACSCNEDCGSNAGKHPATLHGVKDASTDPEQLNAWFGPSSPERNLAVATGAASQTVVLDIDGEKGEDTLLWLMNEGHDLPKTKTSLTGRKDGGRHLWFLYPDAPTDGSKLRIRSKAAALGPGVDVRADAGYVVVPPSTHRTGKPYTWLPNDLTRQPMPQWLLDALTTKVRTGQDLALDGTTIAEAGFEEGDGTTSAWGSSALRNLCDDMENAPEGSRNDTLARVAFKVGQRVASGHIETSEGYAALLDAALAAGLQEREAAQVINRQMLVGTDHPAGPTSCPIPNWPGGSAIQADPARSPVARTPSGKINLPPDFWNARPILRQIQQAAHSRMKSADAVLHGVLARVSASTRHETHLPQMVGGRGSLNYFAILVGASGSGKSSAMSVARALVPGPVDPSVDLVDDKPIGSGEGLAELYMGMVEEIGDDGKKHKVKAQTQFNAFIYVDEGEQVTQQSGRNGATVMETIRRAWNAETLGQSNATKETTRIIESHNYRLAMVLGYQPQKAAELLADDVGGTPQRFMWAAATDESVPKPDNSPPWPGPVSWTSTSIAGSGALDVAASIQRRIRTDAHRQVTNGGSSDTMDAHENLHKLKISALLAVLDSRASVTEDDWSLAEKIWSTSCAVRDHVTEMVKAEAAGRESAAVGRAARHAGASESARLAAQDEPVLRFAKRIAIHVRSQGAEMGVTRRELGQLVDGSGRLRLNEAIAEAIDRDWIVERGERYFPGESRPQ